MTRRLILRVFLIIAITVLVSSVTAFADDSDQGKSLEMKLKASEEDTGVLLKSREIEGTEYFFLPSGVKDENMELLSEENEQCTMMKSSNIASIHFFSSDPEKDRSFIHASRDNKAPGTVAMYDENFELVYQGSVDAIKGRGNATWYNTDKKAYQLKLTKKADLLDPLAGKQKAKKWILLANAYDPTLIRNNMIYAFSKEIGLDNSSEGRPVDLYYDGDYRGSYYLCEKPEIGANRVEIDSLEDEIEAVNEGVDFDSLPEVQAVNSFGRDVKYEDGITDPDDITGGYLLELDSAHYQPEKNWFFFTDGQVIVSKSPEYMSANMMEYISGVFTSMYQYAESQASSLSRGKDIFNYIDRDTFARYFIVNELLDVQDAWVSSTFIYKPKDDDKLYAGPVWDCDSSMRLRFTDKRTNGWMRGQLSRLLLQLPEFRQAVQDIYRDEVRPVVFNILLGDQSGSYLRPPAVIRDEVKESLEMNYMIWDINNNGGNFHPSETVESNYDDMLSWIPARVEWFDQVVMSEDFVPNSVSVNKVKSVTVAEIGDAGSCEVSFDKAGYVVNNIIKEGSFNAEGYVIAYRASGTDEWSFISTDNNTSCQIDDLLAGTTYEIKVRAKAFYEESDYYGDYSDVIYFTVPNNESEGDTPPDTPVIPDPDSGSEEDTDKPDDQSQEPSDSSETPEKEIQAGSKYKVKGNTYKVLTTAKKSKAGTVAFIKAKDRKKVTVPATVKIKSKTFKVVQINAKAFKGKKIRTVIIGKNVKSIKRNAFKNSLTKKVTIKTTKLTKKSVKGCLKGSKVKTIRVKVGKKAQNKKYVKKYKRCFTKKNAGRKVTVK